jgi:ParB family chromosome partitioning protein
MPRNIVNGNLALTGFDDIFKSSTAPFEGESIVKLSIEELYPPEFHPFQLNDDESMTRLSENIKNYGVREPGIARPRAGGGYELLCGNRRKRACELAGITSMPVIIRDMDDDDAVICMVDSNLEQREKLLYSEKAWAYRIKMEALNHNGIKGDMNSVDILVAQTGESRNQIFRLIRLTDLIVDLLDMVDINKLAFNPAVELSYLSQKEQAFIAETMKKYEVKPSLSQAKRIKKMKQSNELTAEMIDNILKEVKKPEIDESKWTRRYIHFFPNDYTQTQIEAVITELLTEWNARVVAAL